MKSSVSFVEWSAWLSKQGGRVKANRIPAGGLAWGFAVVPGVVLLGLGHGSPVVLAAGAGWLGGLAGIGCQWLLGLPARRADERSSRAWFDILLAAPICPPVDAAAGRGVQAQGSQPGTVAKPGEQLKGKAVS